MIDEDRNRAVGLYSKIKQQIDQAPQAILLVGDKATSTLDNLRKHATNLIRMYQIQRRKTNDKPVKDIDRMLKEIQLQQKQKDKIK